MEDKDIIALWKAQDAKLDQTLAINTRLLREIQAMKAKSALRGMIHIKTAGIIALALYLPLLAFALFIAIRYYSPNGIYFLISMGAIFLINAKALYDYIKHLIWVHDIDFDGSVIETQAKLSKLKMSVIRHSRLMVLQFPFWTTFFLSASWFPQEVGPGYLLFQVFMTTSFTGLAYWLYQLLDVKNADKPWYVKLIAGSGGKAVVQAIALYKEVEAFSESPSN